MRQGTENMTDDHGKDEKIPGNNLLTRDSSSGPYRTRTCDPLRVMQVRYQLRQRPVSNDPTTRTISGPARRPADAVAGPQSGHRALSARSPYNWRK